MSALPQGFVLAAILLLLSPFCLTFTPTLIRRRSLYVSTHINERPSSTSLNLFERFTSPSINCLVASQSASASLSQPEVSSVGFLCGISQVVLDDTQDDPGLIELRKVRVCKS